MTSPKLVLVVVLCVLFAAVVAVVRIQHAPPPGERELGFDLATQAGPGQLVYASNGSLDGSPASLAIVIVHGTDAAASAPDLVGTGEKMAATVGVPDALIVAPEFLLAGDPRGELPPDALRWADSGWILGDPAIPPSAPVLSYDAVRAVIARLSDPKRFPALRDIVLAGFSGGAQMVQRYTVVMPDATDPHPRMHYVVADPYSYLYFDRRRPAPGGFAAYGGRCAGFNTWHYGFDGAPAAYGPNPVVLARYLRRRVIYLVGAQDNQQDASAPCAALLQGSTRLERARAYARYITSFIPGGTRQSFAVVSGAAHDADAVLASPCGIEAIFDRPRRDCLLSNDL